MALPTAHLPNYAKTPTCKTYALRPLFMVPTRCKVAISKAITTNRSEDCRVLLSSTTHRISAVNAFGTALHSFKATTNVVSVIYSPSNSTPSTTTPTPTISTLCISARKARTRAYIISTRAISAVASSIAPSPICHSTSRKMPLSHLSQLLSPHSSLLLATPR